jgi:hypothetical protein
MSDQLKLFKDKIANNVQPSPDLTPEEIKIIQDKLVIIKEFYDELCTKKNQIIEAAVGILLQKSSEQIVNNTISKWKKIVGILDDYVAICGTILGAVPGLEPAGAGVLIMCGITTLILDCLPNDKQKDKDQDISSIGGYAMEQNIADSNHYILHINYLKDNVNVNRDSKFKIQDKDNDKANDTEYTLRDLLKYPIEKGSIWDSLIIYHGRKCRNQFVTQQLAREQILDIYFIQDALPGRLSLPAQTTTSWEYDVEHGHCYQPGAAPMPPGTQRWRTFNTDGIGLNVEIFNNSEIVHFRGCDNVGVRGNCTVNSQQNLIESYIDAINLFTTKVPSSYVYPWSITEDVVLSQKWYVVLGKGKLKDDANKPFYTLADDTFLNWLYIDDGAGNIINKEGVAFRYDILRSKRNLGTDDDIFLHAQQIADETTKDLSHPGGKWYWENAFGNKPQIVNSTQCRYGPRVSSAQNAQHHVYVGDLLKFA